MIARILAANLAICFYAALGAIALGRLEISPSWSWLVGVVAAGLVTLAEIFASSMARIAGAKYVESAAGKLSTGDTDEEKREQ